jgi:LuxR family transcriptional regulator, maltose regulon positive regulatory protein
MNTEVNQHGVSPSGPGFTLLASKTTVPVVRRDALDRPRLTSILEAAETPLTLVVAPAGWGKTTLLAQWAAEAIRDRSVGWLTVDAGDDDPHRFWSYVVNSLRSGGAAVSDSALAALAVPALDPIEVAIPQLLNDLAASGQPHILVVDDYHLVGDTRIREAVEYLITYLPHGSRLVIGTRTDPPLPLARWRGRGLITEIRADLLRFDGHEVADLLGIEPAQVAELLHRTEGWAAGVQLVAMASREGPRQLADLVRGERHLIDYLSSEVLTGLGHAQREFMLRTSVLDEVSAPLADHALGITDSARILDELDGMDPFITRLDARAEWFRWHPVARDALRRELDRTAPASGREVLARAAGWYLGHGQYEAAIRHLIAAGAIGEAVQLLLHHEDDFLDAGNIGTFLSLADSLGAGAIVDAPGLGLAMAWAALVSGASHRVPPLLDAADSAPAGDRQAPSGWATFAGSMDTARALSGYESDPLRAESHARRAMTAETDPGLPGHSVSRFALGLVLVSQGRLEEAVPLLEEAWTGSDAAGMPVFGRLPQAGLLVTSLIDLGDLDRARAVLAPLVPVIRRLEEALGVAAGPAIGGLRLAEARLELLGGDLGRARDMLAWAVDLLRVAGRPGQTARGLLVQAEAGLAAGDTEAARVAVAEAGEIARNGPVSPGVSALLDALEHRVARSAVHTARGDRRLFEELTDRELSILRALDGPLSQREIGRELYLSINTVKGYTKSLYRKLGVAAREAAVARARELHII